MARAGGPTACRGSAGCSRSRSSTSGTGEPDPGPRPARHQAALRACRAATGVVFASELKAIVAAVGPELRVDPAGMVASMLYYWLPEAARCASAGCDKLPAGHLGRVPDRTAASVADATGTRGRGRRRGGARAARRPGGRASRTRSRAHLVADVPVASFLSGGLDSSIVTALAHRQRPVDRGVHDRLPRRGPAARGDARRRALRPEDGRAPRDPAARDRDRPGRGRPAAADGRHPRRADRRPGRDQHAADVRRRPRGRGQGAAVRDGRRRAVRRLPQAPGLPARRRATSGCPARLRHGSSARSSTGCRSPSAAAACATVRWAQRFLELRRAARGGGVPAQLHAVRPRRAARAARPGPGAGQVDTVVDRHRASTTTTGSTDHVNRMCLADCADVPAGAQPRPTPTGPAWPPRPRCGCRSSTRRVRGGVLPPRRPQDPRPRAEGRSQGRRGLVAATRSSTARRRRSARRCGPGSPTTSRRSSTTCCSTASWSSSASCAGRRCAPMVADQRSRSAGQSKQLWQLLTLELWYRGAMRPGSQPP